MNPVEAVVPVVAIAAPAALVLLDVARHDREQAAAAANGAGGSGDGAAGIDGAAGVDGGADLAEAAALAEAAGVVDAAEVGPLAVLDAVPDVVPDVVPEPYVADERGYAETAVPAYADSMLSGLTNVETDERSALRRLGAFVLLMVLTVVTAALVGAGIYRTVSALQ